MKYFLSIKTVLYHLDKRVPVRGRKYFVVRKVICHVDLDKRVPVRGRK